MWVFTRPMLRFEELNFGWDRNGTHREHALSRSGHVTTLDAGFGDSGNLLPISVTVGTIELSNLGVDEQQNRIGDTTGLQIVDINFRDDVNDCETATRFRFGDQCFAHLECFLVHAFDDSCEFHFDVLRHDHGCDRRNFDSDWVLNSFDDLDCRRQLLPDNQCHRNLDGERSLTGHLGFHGYLHVDLPRHLNFARASDLTSDLAEDATTHSPDRIKIPSPR